MTARTTAVACLMLLAAPLLAGLPTITFEDISPDQSDTDANDPDGATGGRVNGPQVEIEASDIAKGGEAGYIYGEAIGGWMTPKDKLVKHKHFKDGEWNTFRIVANGPRI